MRPTQSSWSTNDLELCHDEELDDARRAELIADLRGDPALRERLAEVGRLDVSIRSVLRKEHAPSVGTNASLECLGAFTPAVRWRRHFVLTLAAACLLLTLTGVWWVSSHRGVERGVEMASDQRIPTSTTPGPRNDDTEASSYQAIRVVFSLPVRARPAVPTPKTTPAEPVVAERRLPGIAVSSDEVRLTALLAAGRIRAMLDLLSQTPGDRRVAACARFGRRLRAASTAEQILDRLAPREQLAVCRQWVGQPNLRPVVFARLQRFSRRAKLHDEVRTMVAAYSADSSLRGWVRGYQLPGPKPLEGDVAS